MAFDINSFKANFQDRARGYLFYIMLNVPGSVLSTDQTRFLVKSSAVPESTIDVAEIGWQGMMYKLPTTHTYSDWTVTFAVDSAHDLYSDFLNWQKMIHNPVTNEQGNPASYMQDQEVWLLNTSGEASKRIKLVNAWPSSLGEVALDYSSKETQEFAVTFTYMYHVEVTA